MNLTPSEEENMKKYCCLCLGDITKPIQTMERYVRLGNICSDCNIRCTNVCIHKMTKEESDEILIGKMRANIKRLEAIG
jgi:hypothetical protein